MKKLTLDFYGEKIFVPFPKDFASLMKEIEENFHLNLSEVFALDISHTKNKVKKSIKTEDDYKIFICSKANLINFEIVELNDLFQNNLLNKKTSKDKLEPLKKKRTEIKMKIAEKEKKHHREIEEYKLKIESLNHQKAQYIKKLQKFMKDQNEKEKDLVSRITQLSKEIKAKLIFKLPEKGPSPVKGNSKKEKEYLELIKQYNDSLKIGENLFSAPRKNIEDLDKQIRAIYKKYYGNNKNIQEEIFELKKEESLISNEIKKIEIKLGFIKKEIKNKDIDDLINNLGNKIKEKVNIDIITTKEKMNQLKEKIKKNEYEINETEKDILEKMEKENKNSTKEIEKWIEFITNHSQNLIESIEKKNTIQLKQLEDFNKRIDLKKSLSELTVGPGVENIGATIPYTRYPMRLP